MTAEVEVAASSASRPDRLAPLARGAAAIAGAALVGVAAVEAWQVVARYALNDSPGWTEPIALLLLDVAMCLGAAAAAHGRTHFGFFIAQQAAPPRIARALRAFADALTAAIGLVLAVYGVLLTRDAWSVPIAGAGLPQGMMFAPLAVGGALIALFAGARLADPRGVPPP